ncbi:MAG: O-antigen ligase family protein [Kiritimatiellia bacterium]
MHRFRHSRSSVRPRRRGQGFALGVVALAFATTIPWGGVGFFESRLVAAAAWLAGMVGIAWARPGGENDRSAASRAAVAAVALLAAWCGFQRLPLPVGWAVHFWRGDAALLSEIMGDADGWPIALDRFVSLHAALLWAGFGVLAWACARRLRGCRARQTALYGFASLGVFQSLFGLFVLRDTAGRVCGTFGSPNALGGLLAMTLPVTLGLVLFHARHRILRGRTGFWWWFHRLGDSWQAWLRPILWTAWGIQWVALYFTGSIGATISAAAACGILLAWQGKERPESRLFIVVLGASLAVLVLAFSLHARRQNVLDRAMGDAGAFQSSKMSRVEIWRAAWQLCRAFPFGTGPGGSALALPMYQTAFHGRFRLDYAHNDTLQFLGDLGLPGFVPLAFLLGLVLWRGAKASRHPSGQEGDPVWLIRGAWLAVIAALMHAQVEFNLSARPGNQMIFAILCGILWGFPATPDPESGAPDRKSLHVGLFRSAIIALGAAVLWLSLSAAWAWRLHEGVVAAVGLPRDEHLWFRRPFVAPEGIPAAMRQACRLAPGSSRLRQTAAEARTALHQRRIQELAQTLISAEGADLAAGAPLDPANPVHEKALELAALALRLEETDMLRTAWADADAAVRLAPWNASARWLRGRILLRGASLKQLGPDAETRGRRDLELAVALYPMDAGVLAEACSSLSRGANSDRDRETLLDWGSRALALDASLAWTVLDAWWTGRVRVARVLELPRLPEAVLWNLYVRLDRLNRAQEARQCLVALERRLETDPPPDASAMWIPYRWKKWNIRQSQHRIRLAGAWLKRNLREGNWKEIEASAALRAKARHDRFQLELDTMELSGTASRVLRRLRLREWAATGSLSPEWTLEWVLLELEASTPLRPIQDPLAELILMDGLDAADLDRLQACRSAWAESPFLTALLAAQEAESSGRPEKAVATLASLSGSGQVPDRLAHRVWLWRSRLLRRLGDVQAASDALDEAARTCPSDPDVQAAQVESPDGTGVVRPVGMPELDLGFAGGRLTLKRVGLEPIDGASKGTLLHLLWRFRGELPPDLRMDVCVRDEDGHLRTRKAVMLDQEETAKFNRGRPPIGSTWTWTVPLSSFAAKGRMVEVRLRSAGKILPSDDGLSAIELNLEKLPRAKWVDGPPAR